MVDGHALLSHEQEVCMQAHAVDGRMVVSHAMQVLTLLAYLIVLNVGDPRVTVA